MKLLKSIILCGLGAAALSLTSCNDWLDVNTDPNTPSAQSTPYELRLAHIEFYTNSGHSFADWRTSMQCGDWTRYYGGGTYWYSSYWCPTTSPVTTPYQWWFVGAYCNVPDMYEKAMKDENWYYAGCAKIIEAYGTMLMADLYGEMPFDDIKTGSATPEYNTGKELYQRCLQSIDEGIALFEKGAPDPSKPALSTGDWWNKGDASKWLKLGYFLKARWLNKLNKKGAGKCEKDADGVYTTLKYDADLILACLDKAMQSNADNTVINHTDDNGPTIDNLGWAEPVDYSPIYSVCGMNAGYMVTKILEDNMTNFGGYGVEDPRADHVIPWAYCAYTKDNSAADGLKWKDGWRRSKGVDMQSGLNGAGGPLRAAYSADKGGWYINSTNVDRAGDTVYVEATSESKGYAAKQDLLYRRNGTDGSKESGSFYSRVSAPTYVGTYAEACFIRAEILINKGDKAGAFEAYKKGVKASIELMNQKLNVWCQEDPSLKDCPSFTPMVQADIDNYLAKGIGTAADITLGHIMVQKRIALMYDLELWNDMRRYDYNPAIFWGWAVPDYYKYDNDCSKRLPHKDWRRWAQCSHEQNYNANNLNAIGAKVPGARLKDSEGNDVVWYKQDDMYEIPVWWDSTQE